MITLDTSGLLSLFDRKDPYHAACVQALTSDRGPIFIPAAILAEIGWFLEDRHRFASQFLHTFLTDLAEGAYSVEWSDADSVRVAYLVERYDDLPLGIADATVVACAERHGGRILTTDGHFSQVVERDSKVRIAVFPVAEGNANY